jgi:dolichol-phosphate mannosyltransferase
LSDAIDLTVVIPVYNEGENIAPTLDRLGRSVPVPHEVLVVYDFDGDTTLPVVRPMLGEHPNWRLVRNDVARGPSGALRAGFREARGRRVLVVMADLCDDLSQIGTLLDIVPDAADIACPSRYCPGGRQQLEGARLKAWAPRTAGRLLRLLAGLSTHDPTNSFKLYSTQMLDNLRLTSTVSFSVTIEIVAKAHCLGYRIAEIPTTWLDRQAGQSKFKVGRSLVVYFPWFCLMMLRGRLIRLPVSWFRAWFGPGDRRGTAATDCRAMARADTRAEDRPPSPMAEPGRLLPEPSGRPDRA